MNNWLGNLGFSYIGLIYLLILFIPNAIWARNKPAGYDELAKNENKLLLVLERAGQVCTTCCALIFSNYNTAPFSRWSWWFVVSAACMAVYIVFWLRYFKKGPTLDNFYRSLLGIPVPGASLPVAAFLLLGIYGRVIWMVISIALLGIGHIGIHMQYLGMMKLRSEE